jgi:hypothetical protein
LEKKKREMIFKTKDIQFKTGSLSLNPKEKNNSITQASLPEAPEV